MTILDVCQCYKLTSFNSQKDLMGLIVKPSRGGRWEACARVEVGGGGWRNCFSWRWFSLEGMTAQSRYVNQEELRGNVLIPCLFPLDQPSFWNYISRLYPNTLWSQLSSNGCFYKHSACSTEHFKHVNHMCKMEILRKSLTVMLRRTGKRGRIKDNRCSKGLILLIGAWHLFSPAKRISMRSW